MTVFQFAGVWADSVDDAAGKPLRNKAVTAIKIDGTNTNAVLYTDRTKATVTTPGVTDGLGNYRFYADPGHYRIFVTGGPAGGVFAAVAVDPAEAVAGGGGGGGGITSVNGDTGPAVVLGDHAYLFGDGSVNGIGRLVWQGSVPAATAEGTSIDLTGLPAALIPVAQGTFLVTFLGDVAAVGPSGTIEVGSLNVYSDHLPVVVVSEEVVSTHFTTEDGADSIYVDPRGATITNTGLRIVRLA